MASFEEIAAGFGAKPSLGPTPVLERPRKPKGTSFAEIAASLGTQTPIPTPAPVQAAPVPAPTVQAPIMPPAFTTVLGQREYIPEERLQRGPQGEIRMLGQQPGFYYVQNPQTGELTPQEKTFAENVVPEPIRRTVGPLVEKGLYGLGRIEGGISGLARTGAELARVPFGPQTIEGAIQAGGEQAASTETLGQLLYRKAKERELAKANEADIKRGVFGAEEPKPVSEEQSREAMAQEHPIGNFAAGIVGGLEGAGAIAGAKGIASRLARPAAEKLISRPLAGASIEAKAFRQELGKIAGNQDAAADIYKQFRQDMMKGATAEQAKAAAIQKAKNVAKPPSELPSIEIPQSPLEIELEQGKKIMEEMKKNNPGADLEETVGPGAAKPKPPPGTELPSIVIPDETSIRSPAKKPVNPDQPAPNQNPLDQAAQGQALPASPKAKPITPSSDPSQAGANVRNVMDEAAKQPSGIGSQAGSVAVDPKLRSTLQKAWDTTKEVWQTKFSSQRGLKEDVWDAMFQRRNAIDLGASATAQLERRIVPGSGAERRALAKGTLTEAKSQIADIEAEIKAKYPPSEFSGVRGEGSRALEKKIAEIKANAASEAAVLRKKLSREDVEEIGKQLGGQSTTALYEREWAKMMDQIWPGGREGVAKRMEELRDALKAKAATTAQKAEAVRNFNEGLAPEMKLKNVGSQIATKKTAKFIADLERKIKRMREGDTEISVNTSPRATELTRLILPIVRDNLESLRVATHFGLISEPGAMDLAGRYLGRSREALIKGAGEAITPAMRARITTESGRFKQRKQGKLTEDQLSKPGYFYGTAAQEEKRVIQNNIFFDQLTNTDSVSATAKEGWIQLKGKKWGALDKKYVPKTLHEELDYGFGSGKGSMLDAFVDGYLGPLHQQWAKGNTIWSASTHGNNVGAGFLLNYVGYGLRPTEFGIYKEAYSEIRNTGKYYQEAIKNGISINSHGAGELIDLHGVIEGATSTKTFLQRFNEYTSNLPVSRQAGRLYQIEDAWMRMAAYIKMRKSGVPAKVAIHQLNKHIPDYRKIGRIPGLLLRTGYPLMTFGYKQIPETVRLATFGKIGGGKVAGLPAKYGDVAASIRFYGLAGTVAAINEFGLPYGGLYPEQWQRVQHSRPDSVKQGINLFMGFNTANGDLKFMDLTRYNPYPSAKWLMDNFKTRDPLKAMKFMEPSSPLYESAQGYLTGYDSWAKKRIWPESLDRLADKGNQAAIDERWRLWRGHLAGVWLPPYTPPIPGVTEGGRVSRRISNALRGEAYKDRSQTPREALLQGATGVRSYAVQPAKPGQGPANTAAARKEAAKEIASMQRGANQRGTTSDRIEAIRKKKEFLARLRGGK